MARSDGRSFDQLREIKITTNFIKHPEGSCLIECGLTRIICTASVEEGVPSFLKGSGSGWVTAEYGMLPRSTDTRINRERTLSCGRTLEIQRLIGRSLRSVIDLNRIGERTLKIDCDVIEADGGTRTAAITGGFIALALALIKIKKRHMIEHVPLLDYVAAVSVGIQQGICLLDLNYKEDSSADMDMNVVMRGNGTLIEVQGTSERKPFSRKEMDRLLDLAEKGIQGLIKTQNKHIGKFIGD